MDKVTDPAVDHLLWLQTAPKTDRKEKYEDLIEKKAALSAAHSLVTDGHKQYGPYCTGWWVD